jgi:penicillin-insensitive murein endopeptidase
MDFWFKDATLHPKPTPPSSTPKPQMTLKALPPACAAVVKAP